MPGYHGEGSPFTDSFNANAAPLLARIEELERQVRLLTGIADTNRPQDQGLGPQVRSFEDTLSAFRVLQEHFYPHLSPADNIAGRRG